MRGSLVAMAGLCVVVGISGCAGATSDARSAVSAESLVGVWAIDESFDSPEQPFVAFLDDNTWLASDGCNRVQGTWELGDEGSLTTTAGPSTLIACDGQALPTAVATAEYVQITDDVLAITSSPDSTVTTLIRSTDPTVGPQSPVGEWSESDEQNAPFLILADDGTVSGNDGCNVLTGAWTAAADGAIEFGPFASTRIFCEGVDTWLSTAATGRIQAGVMTIEDSSGVVLGQLLSQ